MSRAETLLQSLKENVRRIEATEEKINSIKNKKRLTNEDKGLLDILSRSEFSLCMDNSSIYRNLQEEIRNADDFTRKRIEHEANKLRKVEIVEV